MTEQDIQSIYFKIQNTFCKKSQLKQIPAKKKNNTIHMIAECRLFHYRIWKTGNIFIHRKNEITHLQPPILSAQLLINT